MKRILILAAALFAVSIVASADQIPWGTATGGGGTLGSGDWTAMQAASGSVGDTWWLTDQTTANCATDDGPGSFELMCALNSSLTWVPNTAAVGGDNLGVGGTPGGNIDMATFDILLDPGSTVDGQDVSELPAYFFVSDYVPGGGFNDADIEAALSDCVTLDPAGGCVIELDAQTFVDVQITLPGQVREIFGQGDTTILQAPTSGTIEAVVIRNQQTGGTKFAPYIHDFFIDGNKQNLEVGATVTQARGIEVDSPTLNLLSGVRIENMRIENTANEAIIVIEAPQTRVVNNRISFIGCHDGDNADGGAIPNWQPDGIAVSVMKCGAWGAAQVDEDNQPGRKTVGTGIEIGSYSDDSYVSGNVVQYTTKGGIQTFANSGTPASWPANVIIEGNTVRQVSSFGILLQASESPTVTGNVIRDVDVPWQFGNTGFGLSCTYGGRSAKLTNNVIERTRAAGINAGCACDVGASGLCDVTVSGNTVIDSCLNQTSEGAIRAEPFGYVATPVDQITIAGNKIVNDSCTQGVSTVGYTIATVEQGESNATDNASELVVERGTTGLQNEIEAAWLARAEQPANRSGPSKNIIQFPCFDVDIQSTATLAAGASSTSSGIIVQGCGPAQAAGANPRGGTEINWNGAAGGTIFQLGDGSDVIKNITFRDMAFHCDGGSDDTNVADSAFLIADGNNVQNLVFENVSFHECTGPAVQIGQGTTATPSAMQADTLMFRDVYWDEVFTCIENTALNSVGVQVSGGRCRFTEIGYDIVAGDINTISHVMEGPAPDTPLAGFRFNDAFKPSTIISTVMDTEGDGIITQGTDDVTGQGLTIVGSRITPSLDNAYAIDWQLGGALTIEGTKFSGTGATGIQVRIDPANGQDLRLTWEGNFYAQSVIAPFIDYEDATANVIAAGNVVTAEDCSAPDGAFGSNATAGFVRGAICTDLNQNRTVCDAIDTLCFDTGWTSIPSETGFYYASNYSTGSTTSGVQEAYDAAIAADGGTVIVGPGRLPFTTPFKCNEGFASGGGENGVNIVGFGSSRLSDVDNWPTDGDGTAIYWATTASDSRWIDKMDDVPLASAWEIGHTVTWTGGGQGTIISVNDTTEWLEVETTAGTTPANGVVITNTTVGGTATTSTDSASDREVSALFALEGCSKLTISDMTLIGDEGNAGTNRAKIAIYARARDYVSALNSKVRLHNLSIADFGYNGNLKKYSGGIITDGNWPNDENRPLTDVPPGAKDGKTHDDGQTDQFDIDNIEYQWNASCLQVWANAAVSMRNHGGLCRGWRDVGVLIAEGTVQITGMNGVQAHQVAARADDQGQPGTIEGGILIHPHAESVTATFTDVYFENLAGKVGVGTIGACSEDMADDSLDAIEWTLCTEDDECSGTCEWADSGNAASGSYAVSHSGGLVTNYNLGRHSGADAAQLVPLYTAAIPAEYVGRTLYNTTTSESCVITSISSGAPVCSGGLQGAGDGLWHDLDFYDIGPRYGLNYRMRGNLGITAVLGGSAGSPVAVTSHYISPNPDLANGDLDYVGPKDFYGPYTTTIAETAGTANLIRNLNTAEAGDVPGDYTWTGAHDFGGATRLEVPNSDTLPGSCAAEGDLFVDTDAATGERIYVCEDGLTYVAQAGGGGGGDNVFIQGVAATDPDFRDEGDAEFIRCTGAGAPDASCVEAEDVILRIAAGAVGPSELADTTVLPNTYGLMTATVDQQGRITSATTETSAPLAQIDAIGTNDTLLMGDMSFVNEVLQWDFDTAVADEIGISGVGGTPATILNFGTLDFVMGDLTVDAVNTTRPTGTNQSTQTFQEGAGETGGTDDLTISSPVGGFTGARSCELDDSNTPYDGCVAHTPAPTFHECRVIQDLAAADDSFEVWTARVASTIASTSLHCRGTCTTAATITWEDRAGNAMTGAPTASTGTANSTWAAVSAGGGLVAGEGLAFDVTNAVAPETDVYTFCWSWTED